MSLVENTMIMMINVMQFFNLNYFETIYICALFLLCFSATVLIYVTMLHFKNAFHLLSMVVT